MSSRESIEQGKSGARGAEAAGNEGSGGQNRQGSGRVEARGDEERKHHFAEGRAPSEQGEEGHPSPEQIARGQQGLSGTGEGRSGSNPGQGDRSREEADR